MLQRFGTPCIVSITRSYPLNDTNIEALKITVHPEYAYKNFKALDLNIE